MKLPRSSSRTRPPHRNPLAGSLAMSLAVLAAATVAAGCGTSNPSARAQGQQGTLAAGAPINVGLITSLTGPYAALGEGDREGALIATEQVNAAGGIKGHKVNLIIKDDQTQATQSVVDFNDLLSQNVIGVLGSDNSNSALATGPRAQASKIPYMSLSPSDQLVNPAQSYIFSLPPTSKFWADRDLQWLQSQGITKIAIDYSTDDAFAANGYQATLADVGKYGISIVDTEPTEVATTDFTTALTHVRQSGAQALFAWLTGPAGVIISKQFAAAGLGNVKLIFTGAEASSLYTQPAGAAAEGVIINGYDSDIGDALPAGPLKDQYQKLAVPDRQEYKASVAQFTCDAYSGAELLYAAMQQASALNPAAIDAALNHLSLLTPNGRYTYSPTDHAGATMNNIAVFTVSHGQFVPTDWERQQFSELPS